VTIQQDVIIIIVTHQDPEH